MTTNENTDREYIRISRRAVRWVAAVLAVLIVGTGAVACGKFSEPFKDAKRSGHDDGTPMDVIRMSDGFSNLGSKCDQYGNRVYVAYHGDSAYASVFVLPQDVTCK